MWSASGASSAQRWMVGLLLIGSVGAGIGLPVVPIVRKDLRQPFPCQAHACACANAESCWHRCGCLSDTEKLAWADRQGVTPPASFQRRLTLVAAIGRKSSTGCASCCRSEPQSASGCHSSEGRATGSIADTEDQQVKFAWIDEAHCQKLSVTFLVLSQGSVDDASGRGTPQPLVERIVESSLRAPRNFLEPPDPPPRLPAPETF